MLIYCFVVLFLRFPAYHIRSNKVNENGEWDNENISLTNFFILFDCQVYRNNRNQMIDDFTDFDDDGDQNDANENVVSETEALTDTADDINAMIERLELDKASRDLLRGFLEKSPQHRLKSILALKRIAFFHNFNFDDVRHMKVSEK